MQIDRITALVLILFIAGYDGEIVAMCILAQRLSLSLSP